MNTPAAELLYSTISDLCNVNANSTLLDVCCGTGTIGLTLAKVFLIYKLFCWVIVLVYCIGIFALINGAVNMVNAHC